MKLSVRPWACSLGAICLSACAWSQTEGEPQSGQQDAPPTKVEAPQIQREPTAWDRTQKWWQNSVFNRLSFSGYRLLGYHIQDVSGDREAYDLGNYGGQGDQRFTDLGFVRIEGKRVFNGFDFEFNIQDSRFQDPQADRFKIRYQQGPWRADVGDVGAQLPTANPFARLNRRVSGFTAGYKAGPIDIGIVRSEARGQARTVTIQGTNSAGPYFLQSSQIIRGSEAIEVDGVAQLFGEDYTIDYELGSITFVNRQTLQSKIIPPTSTIVATYESFGFNGNAGRIEGGGLRYNMGSAGSVGVTGIRQVTGAGGKLSTRLEKFQGFGAPSTPYFLQFQPLDTQPILIRLDGVLQQQGVDYVFDAGNPSIFYFNRFVPTTSEIDVLYTPKPTTNVQGDRETTGVDYSIGFSKGRGRFTVAAATGKLTNTSTPTSGRASSIDLAYQSGKFTTSGTLRAVDDGYVSVESTGFSRNEKSSNVNFSYRPDSRSTMQVTHFNSTIAPNSLNPTAGRTRFSRIQADYNLTAESETGLPLTFSVQRASTQNLVQDSQIDSMSLSTSKTWGRFTASLSGDRQTVTGTQSANLLGASLRTSYSAGRAWIFGADAGFSEIHSDTSSGVGTDYTLSTVFRPNDRFAASFRFNESNAGDFAGLGGFSNGFGSGYGGNGFSSGAGSTTLNAASSGRFVQSTFDWTISNRMSLDGAVSFVKRTGSITSNSETKAATAGLNIDFGDGHYFRGGLSRSETQFVNSPVTSLATTADLLFNGNFGGRFSYNFSATALLSGGSSDFAQDAYTYELGLGYQLAKRHALSFNYRQGNTRGYYPQDEIDTSLTYRYQIWESLAFNASYRFQDIRNRDSLLTSGAYKSSGFDFTLAFNFFR